MENSEVTNAIFGFAGLFIGALLSGTKDWLFSLFRKRSDAKYLAVRVVCVLDKFLEDTVDVAFDEGEPGPDGIVCGHRVPDPDMVSYPEDVNWTSIDPQLMYKLMIFPSEIERANNAISWAFAEVATAPDYCAGYQERISRYVALGKRAAELSGQLRAIYKLPDRVDADFCPIGALEKAQEIIDTEKTAKQIITQS